MSNCVYKLIHISSVKMNTTANGASAYTSTNSKCLDFFVLPTRNYDKEKLITLFDNAFKENPLDALRIL